MILRAFAFVLLLSVSTAHAQELPGKAVDTFGKYLYVRERTNHNDHPQIDKWLDNLGLPHGLSWCMASVVGVYEEAAGRKGVIPRTARCSQSWAVAKKNPLRYTTIQVKDLASGKYTLQKGDIIIWKHGKIPESGNFNGHVELIRVPGSPSPFYSRGGNTSSGKSGSQWDGGGVYDRTRYLGLGSSFAVVGVIRLK